MTVDGRRHNLQVQANKQGTGQAGKLAKNTNEYGTTVATVIWPAGKDDPSELRAALRKAYVRFVSAANVPAQPGPLGRLPSGRKG